MNCIKKQDILNQIVASKKHEVADKKHSTTLEEFKSSPYFLKPSYSLQRIAQEQKKSLLIAEFKRKSPSKGIINDTASIQETTLVYQKAGASAISILTDSPFFGGTLDDIQQVRQQIHIPILRKDFIVDEFQIYETKSIGADIILLIASICSKQQIAEYTDLAQHLGLEVLIEVHHEDEIQKLPVLANFIGVNNRNLNSFRVSLKQSQQLIEHLPKSSIKIAESGVRSSKDARQLIGGGFHGLLVGEYLMKSKNITSCIQSLII